MALMVMVALMLESVHSSATLEMNLGPGNGLWQHEPPEKHGLDKNLRRSGCATKLGGAAPLLFRGGQGRRPRPRSSIFIVVSGPTLRPPNTGHRA